MPGNTKKRRRGNNEGCIYQRKDGTWSAVLTVGVRMDGKPNRKFLYGKTRKDVAEKLRDAQNKIDIGIMPGGDNILFGSWIQTWLEVAIKPGINERTYNNYRYAIFKHIIPGLGHYRLKDISDDAIQAYLTEQQIHGNLKLTINNDTGDVQQSCGPAAPSSIIQQRRLIIAALEYAVNKGKLARNPGKSTKRPKNSPKTGNILTHEEMEILAKKGVQCRYYPAFMLALTTGCRRGEILGLSWKYFDIGIPWQTVDKYFPWDEIRNLQCWNTMELKRTLARNSVVLGNGYVHVVQQMTIANGIPTLDRLKTDLSQRTLMITEEMILLIIFQRMMQNDEKKKAAENGSAYNTDDLVFCTKSGTHIHPNNFTKGWSNCLKSMGIDHKRFHDVRHTVATIMLEEGEAVNTVQEQLGHFDAGFTASRYGHVTAKMRNSAALKLGKHLEDIRSNDETGFRKAKI